VVADYGAGAGNQGTLYKLTCVGSTYDYDVSAYWSYTYSNYWFGLAARVTDVNNYYWLQWNAFSSAGGAASLWRRSGGSATQLASFGPPPFYSTVRLRVVGSTITVFYGSILIAQVTDATLATGEPGLGFGAVVDAAGDMSGYYLYGYGLDDLAVTTADHYIEGPALLVQSTQAASSGTWYDQAPVLQVQQMSTASTGDAFVLRNLGSGATLKVFADANQYSPAYLVDSSGNMGLGLPNPGSKLVIQGGTQLISDGIQQATAAGIDGIEVAKSEADVQGLGISNTQYGTRLIIGVSGSSSTMTGPYLKADTFYDATTNPFFFSYGGSLGSGVLEQLRFLISGLVVNAYGYPSVDFLAMGDTATNLFRVDASADSVYVGTTSGGALAKFEPAGIVFNEDLANRDFRVERDADANLLAVDASADSIGMGTAAPAAKLDIQLTDISIAADTYSVADPWAFVTSSAAPSAASWTTGHLTPPVWTAAATVTYRLPLPSLKDYHSVTLRNVTFWYTLAGTGEIDEYYLYYYRGSDDSYSDICVQKTNLASGTSEDVGSGLPVTLGSSDAIMLTIVTTGNSVTLRGALAKWDTD